MQITAITWARNEEDILEHFVRHNLQHVDRMIIVLHRCEDRSKEILTDLATQRPSDPATQRLPIEIRESNIEHHAQPEVLTELMRQCESDWILPLDADEFLCSNQPVHDVLVDLDPEMIYLLPWKTYVPTKDDDMTEDNPIKRIRHRRLVEPIQFTKTLIPHCKAHDSILDMGSHLLFDKQSGKQREALEQDDLWLAHFPVRSEKQLRRKIINGWESHCNNPDRNLDHNFHWKNLYERCKDPSPISNEELTRIAASYATHDDIPVKMMLDPIM